MAAQTEQLRHAEELLVQQKDRAQAQASQVELTHQHYTGELGKLRKKAQTDVLESQEKLEHAHKEQEKNRLALTDCMADLDKEKDAISAHSKELEHSKVTISNLQKMMATQRKDGVMKLAEVQLEKENLEKGIRAQMEELQSSLANAHEAHDAATAKHAQDLKSSQKWAEEELEKLLSKVAAQVEDTHRLINEREVERGQNAQQLALLRQQLADARANATKQQEKMATQESQLDTARQRLEKKEQTSSQQQQEKSNLQNELSEGQQEKNNLRQELDRLRHQLREKQMGHKEELVRLRLQVEEERDTLSGEAETLSRQEREEREEEIEALQQEFEETKATQKEALKELRSRVDRLQEQWEGTQAEQEAEAKAQDTQGQQDEKQERKEGESQAEALRAAHTTLEHERQESRAELERLHRQQKLALVSIRDELDDARSEMASMRGKLEEAQRKMAAEHTRFDNDSTVANATKILEEIEMERREAARVLARLAAENERLKMDLGKRDDVAATQSERSSISRVSTGLEEDPEHVQEREWWRRKVGKLEQERQDEANIIQVPYLSVCPPSLSSLRHLCSLNFQNTYALPGAQRAAKGAEDR
jgi:chromosome segregation ATPase